ncbi:phosphoglycerate dehydrogenase [Microbacterium sp. YY-01]|uniref:phosphoglycerate dehydrogenase n=1 Tax=Microbacterium sp. YY-01 TaxID=3421634 RepID=UPI003D16F860
MKIVLPNTMPLDPTLPEGCTAVIVDAAQPIPSEHTDAEVLVVWGGSSAYVESAARTMPRLRLVQSLSAGVDKIVAAGFSSDVIIASGSGLHDKTVTEHTLALLLTLVRRIPEVIEAQKRHDWSEELGGLQPLHPEDRTTTLLGARVLIWGFGGIAKTLAPLLTALGATVTGVARSAGTRDGYRVVSEQEIAEELPTTDVLISILPDTEATREVINAEIFAALPRHAFMVNVGRGAVVDQTALIAALTNGTIAGAAIDVTTPEPLPADSPLWETPRLLITPHAAGGRPVGANERIEKNVRALLAEEDVLHRV